MALYKLLKPHFLGGRNQQRYFAEGSVVDWDGPPSLHMEPLNDEAKSAVGARVGSLPRERRRMTPSERQLRARIIPRKGGAAPPDATWAPHTRPAFSVVEERAEETKTPSDQADIVRIAASPPSAGGAPTPATDADRAAEEFGDEGASPEAEAAKPPPRRRGRAAKAKK